MIVTYDHYGNKDSERLIYAPYPFGGDSTNTRNRLERLAKVTNSFVIAAHAAGTGRVFTDRATRRSLRPGSIASLALEHATMFDTPGIKAYPKRLAFGDSGRAMWVAHMQLSEAAPFTHVLTRDGVNLRAPEGIWTGVNRVLHDGRSTGGVDLSTVPKDMQKPHERLHTIAAGLAEMAAYGHLMCKTTASVDALGRLAARPDAPFCNVMLGRGISGPESAAQAYNQELSEIREAANRAAAEPRPFLPVFEPTWGHAVLLDPDRAAVHVEQTLAL